MNKLTLHDTSGRLPSLGAFRGFIMMVLISGGFSLGYVVLANHPGYATISHQFDHFFPLLVLGLNSIFIYCIHSIMTDYINDVAGTFAAGFRFIGPFALRAQAFCIFLVTWYSVTGCISTRSS